MDWQDLLGRRGYRITASRRAVMTALGRVDVPLAAAEVLEEARAQHPQLGLVTVYRTLDLFQELGLVRRVHRDDGCHGYTLASPGHHHAIVCRGCGRAAEFTGCHEIHRLIQRAEEETGFQIDGHMLQLSGLCRECSPADRGLRSGHP